MSVLRCSRQQTLFMSFCEASEECQERILRRSSQRFSTTRNHPVWPKGVEAANGARRAFCDRVIHRVPFLTAVSLNKQSSVDCGAGQEAWTARSLRGTVSIPWLMSKRSVK